MKIISTTNARKQIKDVVDRVKYHGEVFGIGRRHSIDALVIQFPAHYNSALDEITNINTYSKSFEFLQNEPEFYSPADLKKRYA